MPTNQYGQQTTDSGHVITESERIEAELSNTTKYGVIGPEAKKDLVKFIMDYNYKDWSANVRLGVSLGRKDAIVMLKAALDWTIDTDIEGKDYVRLPDGTKDYQVQRFLIDNWVELQKVITALEGTV